MKYYPNQIKLKEVIANHIRDYETDNMIGVYTYTENGIKFIPTLLNEVQQFLYECVIKYWKYATIGYEDIDMFKDRFNETFDDNIGFYEKLYNKDLNNFDGEQYSYSKQISSDNTIEDNGSKNTTGTTTSTVQIKDRSVQNSNTSGNGVAENTATDSNTRKDNLTHNENIEYSVERALPAHRQELLEQTPITSAFVMIFYKNFLEVL